MTNLQDYILGSKLFKTLVVDGLLLVEYQCLIDDDQSAVWAHQDYFAYVIGGRKKWKTKNGEYLAAPGQALFVERGAHTVYQYFEAPFFVLFIFLSDPFVRRVLAKYPELLAVKTENGQPADTVIPLSLNEVLEAYFQSLFSYFSQPRPPHRSLLKLKMEELLLNLFHQPGNPQVRRHFVQRLHQSSKVDLETVMRTHYAYPLSIRDYARLSARSLSTFRRDFKAVFNTTPAKWLMQKRLDHSRLLLEASNKSINEIIDESGFRNRSHFMKLFKQSFGLTPGQFRLQHQSSGLNP